MDLYAQYIGLVWPMAFILVSLWLVHKLRSDLNPIFKNVIGGVAKNAQSNALGYAIAIIAATLSSLQELAMVSHEQHWVIAENACRILQPILTTIMAYAMKPPASLALDQPNPKTEPPVQP